MADQLVSSDTPNASIAGAPETEANEVDEHPADGEHAEPWADGFVTSEGIHVPLFVPRAPQEFGNTWQKSQTSRSG